MRVSNDCPPSPHSMTAEQLRQERRSRQWFVLRRRATALLCMVSLSVQQACYNYVPVAGMAELPKGPVVIKVNDRGRVLMGQKLGPLVDQIDGRVVRMDSVNVEVAIETAEDVRGNIARWGGERFTVPREGMTSMTIKKVSKFRSIALAAGIVGAIILGALAVGSSVFSGQDPDDPTVPI
ncbi:MAG: hypothetical protein ACO1Q7_03730 [Gemmatimonas sp.]